MWAITDAYEILIARQYKPLRGTGKNWHGAVE